jgi:hypothetical protein
MQYANILQLLTRDEKDCIGWMLLAMFVIISRGIRRTIANLDKIRKKYHRYFRLERRRNTNPYPISRERRARPDKGMPFYLQHRWYNCMFIVAVFLFFIGECSVLSHKGIHTSQ